MGKTTQRRPYRLASALALLTAVAPGGASADEPTGIAAESPAPAPPPPPGYEPAPAPPPGYEPAPAPPPGYEPAPPAFAKDRPAMSQADWEAKREGAYYTGLPLVNSDPDTGVGYGVRAFRFDNGVRTSELFPYRAFETRVIAQYFATTNGLQYHQISLDAPFFLDGPHRLKLDAVFDQNTAANWFGTGDLSRGNLSDPRSPGTSYATMNDYLQSTRQIENGLTYAFYNKYEVTRPTLNGIWEELFFGGRLRAIAGLMLQYVTIRDPAGSTVKGLVGDVARDGTQGSTLFGEQCGRGELKGCGGGFNNVLKLGLSYDMRDFEPDPNSGYVLEASSQFSGRATGSSDSYAKGTVQARGFWSPFPAAADLVLAGRALYAVQGGSVPFYTMTAITLPDGEVDGLGGRTTIRGYKQSRFVGRVAALANAELRWTFVNFRAIGQHFGLMVVPFVDAGRTFDRVSATSLSDYKFGYGAGFRIAWNQATIINVDYGKSAEGSALYINFGHPF